MAIYLYSDPHRGHKKMAEDFTITRRGVTTKARPFRTVQEMNDLLDRNYREVVRDEDVVWWLGDVMFGARREAREAIAPLPGRRHLILGNHDREDVSFWHALGFEKIRSCWQTEGYLLTHYPVHPSCLGPRIKANIHGHTHHSVLGKPYYNVCVEHTHYAPINFDQVQREIAAW